MLKTFGLWAGLVLAFSGITGGAVAATFAAINSPLDWPEIFMAIGFLIWVGVIRGQTLASFLVHIDKGELGFCEAFRFGLVASAVDVLFLVVGIGGYGFFRNTFGTTWCLGWACSLLLDRHSFPLFYLIGQCFCLGEFSCETIMNRENYRQYARVSDRTLFIYFYAPRLALKNSRSSALASSSKTPVIGVMRWFSLASEHS